MGSEQFLACPHSGDSESGPLSTEFETGAAVVGVVDISAHTFTVSIGDQVMREMPASMGKPRYPTPVGRFSVLQKQRNVKFDSRTIGIPLDDPEGYLINGVRRPGDVGRRLCAFGPLVGGITRQRECQSRLHQSQP
jgi:hypothetical protein